MSVFQDQVVIPSSGAGTQTIATDQPVQSEDLRSHGASGLFICLHIASVTTGNITLRLLGKEPFENTYYAINVDVTVTTTGRQNWIIGPGVSKTPPGEAAATTLSTVRQFVGIPIPDVFRIELQKSDTSSWVVGVSIRRIP